jgi:GNAT superfamily N-acetyltransferase
MPGSRLPGGGADLVTQMPPTWLRKPSDSLDRTIFCPVTSTVMSSLMRNGLMRNEVMPSSPISDNPNFPVIRPLRADDLKSCAELSVDRGWWPERDKWSLLLAASEAYGVDAPDGQGLAGTVVVTRWGTDRAAIGMMLIASRYGGHGLGRALMEHALRVAGEGTAVSLYATGAGRPLYDKLGFQPVRRSVAFRGQFRAGHGRKGEASDGAAGLPGDVRVATEADLPAILTLDRAMYGADRERMLTRLPAFADRIVVFEASEGIAGYAAAWRTEPFMVIGPLVAPDDAAARRLITDLGEHSTVPLRLDLDPDRSELVSWARARGLLPTERTVFMTRGDLSPRGVPERVFTPISVAMA